MGTRDNRTEMDIVRGADFAIRARYGGAYEIGVDGRTVYVAAPAHAEDAALLSEQPTAFMIGAMEDFADADELVECAAYYLPRIDELLRAHAEAVDE